MILREGGAIKVTFITFGRSAQEVETADDSTVADVLSFVGIDCGRGDIFINGTRQGMSSVLKDGDIVGLFFSIRGGATVKRGGDSWMVYKSDPDTQFPSDFHAHNNCAEETLDIYTGIVYSPVTKKPIRRLNSTEHEYIIRRLLGCKEPGIIGKSKIAAGNRGMQASGDCAKHAQTSDR